MKFSKTSRLHIPEYPYKQMKKVIKLRQHDVFLCILSKNVLRIGTAWKKQADRVFFRAFLRCQTTQLRAQELLNTAGLYREATRKIIKKYNKQTGSALVNDFEFEFQKLLTIKRLQGVCGVCVEDGCCVCLDALFYPRSQTCGHLICRSCYDRPVRLCPVCRRDGRWFYVRELEPCLRHRREYGERVAFYVCHREQKQLLRVPIVALLT